MDHEKQKEHIADLYHRVAPDYGHVGPNFFAFAGQRMVELIGIKEWFEKRLLKSSVEHYSM